MDWNILEGTINGWDYTYAAALTGAALTLGLMYMKGREYNQLAKLGHAREENAQAKMKRYQV